MYINTNIVSLNAQANLANSQSTLATDIQRLSSGLRINSAADDAAGMAIATRMGSQIAGQNQAIRNANDGISLAQTAQGAMQSIVQNLQTMRSLAVQSANATYSASDRASMNAKVQQLKAEIDRVAGSTAFNGVNLLNGTFTAQNFQVGANNTSNDVIQVASIANMGTTQLGSAGSSYSSNYTGTATTAALAAGDLTLNGYQVGASQLGSAPGQTADSAYSIAQAINSITSSSGVTATANATTVTGTVPTGTVASDTGYTPSATSLFGQSLAANSFSVNGVNVGAVVAGGTAAGEGANLAAAINAVTAQTGVTATANASTGAVSLSAADGRNIQIQLNSGYFKFTDGGTAGNTTLNGASTGNSTSANYSGSAQLQNFLNLTGFTSSQVSVASTVGTATQGTGIGASGASYTVTPTVPGTSGQYNYYQMQAVVTIGYNGTTSSFTAGGSVFGVGNGYTGGNVASAVTGANIDSALGATSASGTLSSLLAAGYHVSGSFANGNFQVTGPDGKAVSVSVSYQLATETSSTAGTATVNGNTVTAASSSTAATAVNVGGVAVAASNFTGGTLATGSALTLSSVTGGALTATGQTSTSTASSVTSATKSYGGISTVAGGTALISDTTQQTHGTISLSSTQSGGIVIGGALATEAGFTTQTVASTLSSTVNSISAMDVLTASDASNAIATIDGAINTVNTAMGQMGAVQNRFQSVVTTLQTSVQNLSAAQSRIQDTDFAATTASLTQAQILQQAGTAMLAQANALPNAVLTLLK